MGMTTARSLDPEPMMEMNMTPLIDVMLVLIIMFIITIPIQNHSVSLNMPTGPTPPQTIEPKVVDLTVDFDGTVYWNNEIINHAKLESNLASIGAVNNKDQAELHLRAHKLAKYRDVARVMASAQRLGVGKIGMVGNEQFL